MKLRSARTLVFSREQGEIVGFNFLTRSTFSCSSDLLKFLALIDEWTEFDDLLEQMPTTPRDVLKADVQHLLDVDAVTAFGSPLADKEDEFSAVWKWSIPAALLHFSVQDRRYLSADESESLQIAKLAACHQPQLFMTNGHSDESTLKLPTSIDGNDLIQLMARRRTIRSATATPISLVQLSDCLFAGLGIIGKTRNCAGPLPLSMTPSGGARNPYEAYVFARSVEGLERGFYHYSAFDHTLSKMTANRLPMPSELLGGQEWADEMPCIIILCAFFERTMWKYDDANAYRVVLIEAGHIGQNLMLAATRHGLSACPSAALNHSEISRCILAGKSLACSPIYAMTLAQPQAEAA